MEETVDFDQRIEQIEERRHEIESEIKALNSESRRLYKEQVSLTNEKYRKSGPISEKETQPEVLAHLVYDAGLSSSAADRLLEWISTFGNNFLPVWANLNGDGTMPSVELGFEEDEPITEEKIQHISAFASLVHGGTGYAIFPIREHSYKTTGDWHLIVAGEKFDRGEVVNLQHLSEIHPEDIVTPLDATLLLIAENHWML